MFTFGDFMKKLHTSLIYQKIIKLVYQHFMRSNFYRSRHKEKQKSWSFSFSLPLSFSSCFVMISSLTKLMTYVYNGNFMNKLHTSLLHILDIPALAPLKIFLKLYCLFQTFHFNLLTCMQTVYRSIYS